VKEELARWIAAAKPGLPMAIAVLMAFLSGALVAFWLGRSRRKEAARLESAARQSEAAAKFMLEHYDRAVNPTQEIDMRVLTAHMEKAKFSPLKVLTDVRERITARAETLPDWAPGELGEMPPADPALDRSGWPNTTYQRRGWLPRLRRPKPTPVNPKTLGERIARLRNEQKAKLS
jgi:hypothetical protein